MTGLGFLSRRRLLVGASAILALDLIPAAHRAAAKAPFANTQAPAFYRFKVGGIEATVISDGPLALGAPSQTILGPKEEIEKILADNFLSTANWAVEQNILVLNTGDRIVVFDTGMGASTLFGPDSGRMLRNLKAAGVEPKDVDAVVISHGHCDHCWGLLAADGSPHFPNAQLFMTEADFRFWTDEAKASINDIMKLLIEGARRQLLPNRERFRFIKDGEAFLPGIQAIAAPGHTVGHMIFMITSQGQTLCNIADVGHHHVLSFEKPRYPFGFDTDAKQGVDTRLRVLDMLASGRTQMIAYHFPWPGIGHVVKHGDGYRFIPTPLSMGQP